MKWLKWTIVAAAGLMPALALADETDPTSKPSSDSVQIRVTPSTGEVEVRHAEHNKKSEKDSSPAKESHKPGESVPPTGAFKDGNFVIVREEQEDQGAPLPFDQREAMRFARGALRQVLDGSKHEKGAYLGVSATPPPTVLRKQLGLTPGMGLVVEFVMPDSPAAKAGLQKYDVLQKLDDQFIVNPPQLSVLVRTHKPGDEIKLTIIRDGKEQMLIAKLIEHDVEPLVDDEDAPGAMPMHIDRMFPEPHLRQIGPGDRPANLPFPPGWRPTPGNAMKPSPDAGPSSITWLESDRSYSLVTDPSGHKNFTVKDRDGKSIFEGFVDTDEQREKVPAELKEKLHHLQQELKNAQSSEKRPKHPNPED